MKQNFLLIFLIISLNTFSQDEAKKDTLWTTRGNVAILLNQTGFSDWVGGGTNNFSGTIKFDYEWEYEDKGWNWLTNFESAYGLAKYKNAPFARKIDDRIYFNLLLVKNLPKIYLFQVFLTSLPKLEMDINIVRIQIITRYAN